MGTVILLSIFSGNPVLFVFFLVGYLENFNSGKNANDDNVTNNLKKSEIDSTCKLTSSYTGRLLSEYLQDMLVKEKDKKEPCDTVKCNANPEITEKVRVKLKHK